MTEMNAERKACTRPRKPIIIGLSLKTDRDTTVQSPSSRGQTSCQTRLTTALKRFLSRLIPIFFRVASHVIASIYPIKVTAEDCNIVSL